MGLSIEGQLTERFREGCELFSSMFYRRRRCGGNTRLLVEETRQRIERRGESRYVYLWPKNRRRHKPLCLRLMVLKRSGKRVYLLTNVLGSPCPSRSMAGELYRAR